MVEHELLGYENPAIYHYEVEGELESEDSVNPDDDDGESQSSSGDSETHPCNEPDVENCDD